jgi:hypothetical protein
MNMHKHFLIIIASATLIQSNQTTALSFPWAQTLASWTNKIKSYSRILPYYWHTRTSTQKALICGFTIAGSYGLYKGITSLIKRYRTITPIVCETEMVDMSTHHPRQASTHYSASYISLRKLSVQATIPAPSSINAHAILEVDQDNEKCYFAVKNKFNFEICLNELFSICGFLFKPSEQEIMDYQKLGLNARDQFLIKRNVTMFFDTKTIARDKIAKKFYENPIHKDQVKLISIS